MSALAVVICSLNGAEGVDRCLRALAEQSAEDIEVVVVDDGSSDHTSDVAVRHGAKVVRHAQNRGLAASRNAGIRETSAPIVGFLDDDCEPAPDWAARIVAAYSDSVMGVGGPVVPEAPDGFVGRYLKRQNPLRPPEAELGRSTAPIYRLWLYLRRQWKTDEMSALHDVYSLVGANMSFRRDALRRVGGFDERFHFGAEELDLCRRLARDHPDSRLVVEPAAVVLHHFDATFSDVLRRSRAYGRGSARMYRKWPAVRPSIFPVPVLVLASLLLSLRRPWVGLLALLTPPLVFPRGLVTAVRRGRPPTLLDPYIQVGQECAENVGFVEGWWRFRDLTPEEHSVT